MPFISGADSIRRSRVEKALSMTSSRGFKCWRTDGIARFASEHEETECGVGWAPLFISKKPIGVVGAKSFQC